MKRQTPSVLVVDDEPGIREGLTVALRREGWLVSAVAGLGAARVTLAHRGADCILLDVRLKDGDGLDFLRELKQGAQRDIPVIVATAFGDGERTIAAMRDGAFDYITKPFDLPNLVGAVRRAVGERAAKLAPLELHDEALVGRSASMHAVWKRIGRAAAGKEPVLVLGEAGSGKETVARAIHRFATGEAATSLHHVRAASLDPAQLDALLQQGDTLLLDELGELPRELQHLLAQRLRQGTRSRVICTGTHANELGAAVAMRELLVAELYAEIAVVEIEVPPLRARRSDVPLLVAHALASSSVGAVSEAAMTRLLAHEWPGNVRELLLTVRRGAALAEGDVIEEWHLPDELGGAHRAPSSNPYRGLPLRDAVAAVEKDLLREALERASGNRTLAAKLLGIARPQLYTKLAEHDLEGHGKER